jgi:hypothetical protein
MPDATVATGVDRKRFTLGDETAMVSDAVIELGGIDVHRSLRVLTMLPGDPTIRLEPGRLRRATITPDGAGVIDIAWSPGADTADVRVDGDGGAWLLSRASALCGGDDDVNGFDPDHPSVRELWRRHASTRIIRTATLWHDLAWWIVQQRVARDDAARQWARLVRAHGSPSVLHGDVFHPPQPDVIAHLGYHELHAFGIERRRAVHLIAAARAARRLHDLVAEPFEAAERVLRAIDGVGAWTLSGLAAVTWGERDAVIVGDSGIPGMVGWMVARERNVTDARMLELLEPFRPHRYRVIKLAFDAGVSPPRRHHRLASPDIRRR